MFCEIRLDILNSVLKDWDPPTGGKHSFYKIFFYGGNVKVCCRYVFYDQNSNSNLRRKRLMKFSITWPKNRQISKRIEKSF